LPGVQSDKDSRNHKIQIGVTVAGKSKAREEAITFGQQ